MNDNLTVNGSCTFGSNSNNTSILGNLTVPNILLQNSSNSIILGAGTTFSIIQYVELTANTAIWSTYSSSVILVVKNISISTIVLTITNTSTTVSINANIASVFLRNSPISFVQVA
jgi:hypothetical protein